ncbi:MAG: Hsp70 family protein [Desulfobacterales bacterium]|nr:Hsp70 family protein [Desulfobacterales bacterium]
MEEIKKIYGIDLGTTYSCIAHIDKNGEPVIIKNFEGDDITPSVVYFESENNIIVGAIAKDSAELYPERIVDFVKRKIGRKEDSNTIDGKEYKPEEISAFIINKLVKDASSYLGEPVTDVVITCPAYFGIMERDATRNAGIIAGLNVHNVINEPTAAAFSYGLDRSDENQVILVYDFGGGTFDVTVIEINNNDITVITTGGNHELGGKDWDDRLIAYFTEEFMNEHGEDQDPRDDRQTLQYLRNKVEDLKKKLTSAKKYIFNVEYNGLKTQIEITQEKFAELTGDLLDKTIDITKNQLEIAKSKGFTPSKIILVGGSSRMPMVASKIKSELGFEPIIFEPDQAVAKGAALSAHKTFCEKLLEDVLGDTKISDDLTEEDKVKIEEKAKEFGISISANDIKDIAKGNIVNITSKAFGIVLTKVDENGEPMRDENGEIMKYVHHMIDLHSPLPAEKIDKNIATLNDNQSEVEIKLAEQADGNSKPSENLEHNIILKEDGKLELPPNLPRGSPIHCTFRLGEDGRLSVYAFEPSSRKECVVNAEVEGIMSKKEVEDAKQNFIAYKVS